MPNTNLLDNDIALKVARYRVVDELLIELVKLGDLAVLKSAFFVITSRLRKSSTVSDRVAAEESFAKLFRFLKVLEPSNEEVFLAANLEDQAILLSVSLDSGESLLFAMFITRRYNLIFTGDKRAISAIEKLSGSIEELLVASGKVICLEQVFQHLLRIHGAVWLKKMVCGDPTTDRALAICFSCHSDEATENNIKSGLNSYIDALRAQAPKLLMRSNDLSVVMP